MVKVNMTILNSLTLKNTVISPNFLVWKFWGDSPETMWKLCLSTNFHTIKLGEITVFYAGIFINER